MPKTKIDTEELQQALDSGKVVPLNLQARRYAKELIKKGHCPCHLVVHCKKCGKGQ